MMQNPVSITIFFSLFLLIIALLFATVYPSWRYALVKMKLLEEDEEPASFLIWILGIIITVKLIQAFIVQPFIVDGGSMLPTYHNQDFLIVDKVSYRLGEPRRVDVIIFKLFENKNNPYEGKYLIKRLIGKPGERIVVRNGITTIYNSDNPQGFTLNEPYITYSETDKNVDITLDENHYFVMGDNRSQSYDSRDWGPLDVSYIKGQVLFRLYPFGDVSYEPGQYTFSK
jgi:signal peptidase I